jgi:hypothetical protein
MTLARRRWPWRILTALAVLALAVFWVPTVETRHIETSVDPVTGTMTWKTSALFGVGSGTRVNVSPLETRLRASGISWSPSQRYLHNTSYSLLGKRYACSSAPPIYDIIPVLKEFAAASTDEELREFVRVMQSGTDDQQKAAVDAATEKAFRLMEEQRPH